MKKEKTEQSEEKKLLRSAGISGDCKEVKDFRNYCNEKGFKLSALLKLMIREFLANKGTITI